MPADDLFKRYLEVGASMLGMSRERAEGIVADLVASGEVARGQATKAADWLVERGRAGTEELAELIRAEVRRQVTAMGLATSDDIARLETRIDALAPPAPAAPGLAATPRAGAGDGGPTRRPRKAAAPATAKAAADTDDRSSDDGPEEGGRDEGGPGGAGITRSASVRRRSGATRSGPSGVAPPDGDAIPPKD